MHTKNILKEVSYLGRRKIMSERNMENKKK